VKFRFFAVVIAATLAGSSAALAQSVTSTTAGVDRYGRAAPDLARTTAGPVVATGSADVGRLGRASAFAPRGVSSQQLVARSRSVQEYGRADPLLAQQRLESERTRVGRKLNGDQGG
jgi:hypothetical protein